jgi:glutathione S-transferase
VPVLLHGSNVICDSNAILCYLAYQFEAWNWWPQEPDLVWQIQRWMSVAAGELLAGPVIARRITVYKRDFDQRRAIAASNRFLAFLDGHLCDKTYLVNNAPTVADIAIYTYTAHAPEGAISLKPFNHVRNWLRRIESWPRFIGMQPSRIPEPLNI